ncbi:MAG: hypothetical protein ACAI44_10270 [Candidatus Sericytochromatia bacterium]
MASPRNFRMFILAGALELLLGLGFSVFVGLTHSWVYAAIIAVGFFISANVMFMIAYKKLG